MIKTYSYAKDGATKLTPHFRVREFRDKSGGDSFPLDDYLPALLERLYTRLVQDGHGEVCKSYTYTQHQMVPDIVIISTETWESLDEAEQSAIVNGMTQGNEAHEAVWQDLVQENIDGAKEMGVQFYTIDKTAFIEATQSLRDEFCAKSADNARYYEDFLSYVQA